MLHNRMPREWRAKKEIQVHEFFGESSGDNDKILLTNQVAEAGLDISAPLVISDPAPVDTLVQRAGRCARWFRNAPTHGEFVVLDIVGVARSQQNENAKKAASSYILPYRADLTEAAFKQLPTDNLSWEVERGWVNAAWGGDAKKAAQAAERAVLETTFALNLFDRASQEQRPGEIANTFREVLSVEVAVEKGSSVYLDDLGPRDLNAMLEQGQLPDTSSISLKRAYALLRGNKDRAVIIRYSKEENQLEIGYADQPQLGDIIILPSSMAYLHQDKGLCFGDVKKADETEGTVEESSEWKVNSKVLQNFAGGRKQRQTLSQHTLGVMRRATRRLTEPQSLYRQTMLKVLRKLEPRMDEAAIEKLADLIVQLTRVAIAFHDLGKAHHLWQSRARKIDPDCSPDLIGRTLVTSGKIGLAHTPPGYSAALVASQMLLGANAEKFEPLLRAIALASCRHHSSLFNPAKIKDYAFEPHAETVEFVAEMLTEIGAPPQIVARAAQIVEASQKLPEQTAVPLMLPTDDLFPIYALVGRAIMLSDREDAAQNDLEQWQ